MHGLYTNKVAVNVEVFGRARSACAGAAGLLTAAPRILTNLMLLRHIDDSLGDEGATIILATSTNTGSKSFVVASNGPSSRSGTVVAVVTTSL
ncbi:hypothetical protein EVAR_58210_1 [Eumeta japonica]|uniref:Uncharacterized protein n=1 Tax=Eumeta variegata TaxID=151549 RepID=A0A4C1YTA8_EUMVA|nr:hypothetical protein EVAR_58210_1 [Eumeta japonica]